MSKIRFKYEKEEEVKYIAHLETVKMFDRVLRRSGLPVKFSQGYNPRPEFVFALPTSVGLISYSEYIEMDIQNEMSIEEIISILNKILPKGFRILNGEYIATNKSMMALVEKGEYIIKLTLEDINDNVINDIKNIFEQDEIILDKKVKDPRKKEVINIKPFILSYTVGNDGKTVNISVLLKAGSSENLRPDYIVKAVEKNNIKVMDFDIIRTNLILKD